MRILFIGDIVGRSGRQAVAKFIPEIQAEVQADFIVANGENAAAGLGITKDTALEILDCGVNVITLGNHVWARKEINEYLNDEPRLVRPANYPSGVPGRGWAVYSTNSGLSVAVFNLCGRVFMDCLENPFLTADKILETLAYQTNVIIVDFHAEATSEKAAFAWYLDGRVTAVIGTHTHVQTADERILPGGTAFITDVGMTGPVDSVIGLRKELIISRFLTLMPSKFDVAEGEALFSAVIIDVDSVTGKALNIRRLQKLCS